MLFIFQSAWSQTENSQRKFTRIYDHQFELRHDNDFLLFTDRYYTTGTFIGLRKLLDKGKDTSNTRHYSAYVLQQFYTPSDLLANKVENFDRPYVGFFGISNALTISNKKRLWDHKVLLGFTGPLSGASVVQSFFHESLAAESRIAAWEDQIKNGFHANFYLNYVREWDLKMSPFQVFFSLNPSGALGTKDIFFQQDVAVFLGKRQPMNLSSAYQQLGNLETEIFFAVRAGYRYIFHDSLLEGNVLRDPSVFLVEPYQNMFLYNFEMYFRRKRGSYKVSYNFSTPTTRTVKPHLYMLVSYSKAF
ncbi:MAG: DUF2219 family protein [Flavobacteriaceae bacterium]|nr:DUF2219 family protein [Flavobacteriaceae bacterium]